MSSALRHRNPPAAAAVARGADAALPAAAQRAGRHRAAVAHPARALLSGRPCFEPRQLGERCLISSPSLAGVLLRMRDAGLVARAHGPRPAPRARVADAAGSPPGATHGAAGRGDLRRSGGRARRRAAAAGLRRSRRDARQAGPADVDDNDDDDDDAADAKPTRTRRRRRPARRPLTMLFNQEPSAMQPHPTDLADCTASELLRLYRSRQASLGRGGAGDTPRCAPEPGARCVPRRAGPVALPPRASEARWMSGTPCGELDGVPLSIKDLILTAGWPCARLAHHRPGPAVGRRRQPPPACARPARCCSARRRRPVRLQGQDQLAADRHRATRGTWRARPAARRAAQRRRWPPAWGRSRSVPTARAACASRRRSAATSA